MGGCMARMKKKKGVYNENENSEAFVVERDVLA